METTIPTVTKAQKRTLKALADLMVTNPAPSIAEWAEVAGAHGEPLSMPSIMQHRAVLEAKGLIANTPGKVRSTHVTPLGLKVISQ